MENGSMPVGLMMALAERPEAMLRFAGMDAARRARVLDQARRASSKEAMRQLVRDI